MLASLPTYSTSLTNQLTWFSPSAVSLSGQRRLFGAVAGQANSFWRSSVNCIAQFTYSGPQTLTYLCISVSEVLRISACLTHPSPQHVRKEKIYFLEFSSSWIRHHSGCIWKSPTLKSFSTGEHIVESSWEHLDCPIEKTQCCSRIPDPLTSTVFPTLFCDIPLASGIGTELSMYLLGWDHHGQLLSAFWPAVAFYDVSICCKETLLWWTMRVVLILGMRRSEQWQP